MDKTICWKCSKQIVRQHGYLCKKQLHIYCYKCSLIPCVICQDKDQKIQNSIIKCSKCLFRKSNCICTQSSNIKSSYYNIEDRCNKCSFTKRNCICSIYNNNKISNYGSRTEFCEKCKFRTINCICINLSSSRISNSNLKTQRCSMCQKFYDSSKVYCNQCGHFICKSCFKTKKQYCPQFRCKAKINIEGGKSFFKICTICDQQKQFLNQKENICHKCHLDKQKSQIKKYKSFDYPNQDSRIKTQSIFQTKQRLIRSRIQEDINPSIKISKQKYSPVQDKNDYGLSKYKNSPFSVSSSNITQKKIASSNLTQKKILNQFNKEKKGSEFQSLKNSGLSNRLRQKIDQIEKTPTKNSFLNSPSIKQSIIYPKSSQTLKYQENYNIIQSKIINNKIQNDLKLQYQFCENCRSLIESKFLLPMNKCKLFHKICRSCILQNSGKKCPLCLTSRSQIMSNQIKPTRFVQQSRKTYNIQKPRQLTCQRCSVVLQENKITQFKGLKMCNYCIMAKDV